MKKKQFLTMMSVLLVMLLCFASCGKSGDSESTSLNTDEPRQTETVGAEKTSNAISQGTDSGSVTEEPSSVTTEPEKETTTEQTTSATTKTEQTTTTTEKPKEESYKIYSIGHFDSGLAMISTSIGYGYINTDGVVVIPPEYEDAEPFFRGVARVKKSGKYGYIKMDGSLLMDTIYDSASAQFDDFVLVKSNGISHYVDIYGNVIYTVTGKEVAIGEYCNGYIWVETKESLLSGDVHTMTYYNEYGKAFSIPNAVHCTMDGTDVSSINGGGCAFVKLESENRIRMIDENGNIYNISSANSDNVTYIYGNYVAVSYGWNNADYLYVDYLSKKWYPSVSYFSQREWFPLTEGGYHWFDVANNPYFCTRGDMYRISGYDNDILLNFDMVSINLSRIPEFAGATIVSVTSPQFGETYVNGIKRDTCYYGVVLLSSSNVIFYSMIDFEGNVVIAPTKDIAFINRKTVTEGYLKKTVYELYDYTRNGVCKAQDTESGLYGFIDMKGNWVIKPQYQSATDMHSYYDGEYHFVAVVNDSTIVDSSGNIIPIVDLSGKPVEVAK